MRRALLKKFALVLLAALFLNSLIFYGASSRSILNSTREDMLYILESADSLLEYGGDLNGQVARLELVTDRYDSRLTVIAADGSVAADTEAVAASLDNHLDREEVEAALKGGSGYAIRHPGQDHALCSYALRPLGQRAAFGRALFGHAGIPSAAVSGGHGQFYAGFGVLHRGDGAFCVLGHPAAAGDFPGDAKGKGGLPLPEI